MTRATITERHEGVVTSVEDGENLGRIKATCPGLTGDESTELPFLINPVHDWGWFTLPDVGEMIELEVVAATPQDEIYGQASLEALNPRWRGKRFINSDAPIHPDFVAQNYGKRRGFATPNGHIFIIDDEANTVRISWMTSPDAGEDARSSILFDGDGKIHIIHKDQHEILLESAKLTVKLNDGNALILENSEANVNAKLGNGAVHVAIVEHLKTLYDNLKSWANTHTHPVPSAGILDSLGGATSGSATSSPPSSQAPDWSTAIESTKVSIPDG